jgi:hypothetical protein
VRDGKVPEGVRKGQPAPREGGTGRGEDRGLPAEEPAPGIGFSPYSVIGKFFAKNKSRPLQRLAIPVRYAAAGKDPMTVGIGFTGRISASWKKIAERQQEGYEYSASEGFRRALFLTGTELRKKKRAEAKYFFLRPSTTRLKDPARPIIDPFWNSEKGRVMPQIRDNYERKLRGERI